MLSDVIKVTVAGGKHGQRTLGIFLNYGFMLRVLYRGLWADDAAVRRETTKPPRYGWAAYGIYLTGQHHSKAHSTLPRSPYGSRNLMTTRSRFDGMSTGLA